MDTSGVGACVCPLASPVQPLVAAGVDSFLCDSGLVAAISPGLMPGPERSILCSKSMWFWGGSPTQALRGQCGFSRAAPGLFCPASPVSHPPPGAPENVLDTTALAEECIHHWAARRHEWGLKEEAEQRQHRVEALRLRVRVGAEAHSLTELCEQY